MSEAPCKACVRRWEMGDVQGSIDPRVTPWHDPHHALIHTERERADRLEAFAKAISKAYDDAQVGGPGGKPLSPFFFGQRLRRVVREARAALKEAGP